MEISCLLPIFTIHFVTRNHLTADWLSTVLEDITPEQRNVLVNALVRQLIAFLRYIITNGSSIFGIPVLDPLELESYHFYLPAGIIK